MIIRRAVLAVLLLAPFGPAGAQDVETPRTGMVRIESQPSGAEVYAGDSLIGRTPIERPRALMHALTVWYPSRSAWPAWRDTIPNDAPAADAGVVLLRFPMRVTVASVPYGAAVFNRDSLLGHTPLSVDATAGACTLRLSVPGYDDAIVTVEEGMEAPVIVTMHARAQGRPAAQVIDQAPSLRLPPPNVLVPGVAGLASGILAVILKQEADATYERYRSSGDPALLDKSRQQDVYAGVALAITELALAWVVWQLFDNR